MQKASTFFMIAICCLNSNAQSIGTGTITPATRLDMAGNNRWNLAGSEDDTRIVNSSYRSKSDVVLSGRGAGAANIPAWSTREF